MARAKTKVQTPARTREGVIRELLKDPFHTLRLEEKHPALTPFSDRDRKMMLRQVEKRQWDAREAKRLPILMERLATWPPEQWGTIFAERPDLEGTLTREQKARWRNWLREHAPGALPEGEAARKILEFRSKEQ